MRNEVFALFSNDGIADGTGLCRFGGLIGDVWWATLPEFGVPSGQDWY